MLMTSVNGAFSKKLEIHATDPDNWFTELEWINGKIHNIKPTFAYSNEQMTMHIMNGMCKDYRSLKILIENENDYLNDLEGIKETIQDHWDTYHGSKDNLSEEESDSDNETNSKTNVAFNVSTKNVSTIFILTCQNHRFKAIL